MLDIQLAELHSTIFVGGRNLGKKLSVKMPGLSKVKLRYDRAEKELLVQWGKETAIVPVTNIVAMVPVGWTEEEQPIPASVPVATKITAQVDTPIGHVFKGEGHGKTGRDK